KLRSPVCCILGHVNTGKTTLLDTIRGTKVQLGEMGGITQQIGATFFPRSLLEAQTARCDSKFKLEVPGLLIIDTPGHASFSSLRKRGSSICDIAILVVDIGKGVEPQTLESINLLKKQHCPFIVALNKIDLTFGWKSMQFATFKECLKRQPPFVLDSLKTAAGRAVLNLIEKCGMNFSLFHENKSEKSVVSVVPISAATGEGLPDLLATIIKLTQKLMRKQIVIDTEHVDATVLEVKTLEGLGTCIDVLLIGGALRKKDTIVLAGHNGPIVTQIKALMTPMPLRESRVKGEYEMHEAVTAAVSVRIAAPELEQAIAGSSLYVCTQPEAIPEFEEKVRNELSIISQLVDHTSDGVILASSTLGAAEALLDHFKDQKIPVNDIVIGTVHKKDVVRASVMRERNCEEYAVIAAFNVKIDEEARTEAAKLRVALFEAEIIYQLSGMYARFHGDIMAQRRAAAAAYYVSPAKVQMLPSCVFNKKAPLIFGVEVTAGELRVGTPLFALGSRVAIGSVDSIEHDKKAVKAATPGMSVAIKVSGSNVEIDRQLDAHETLVSAISRRSIDVGKQYFLEEVEKHKKLFFELKGLLNII
uniref:Eukaryotic translation initiation factor 5B n=1 Tax=Dermatophagoides pteronyssinus TaxID=6956 RepID=A0A6P6Y4L0_DERPT